MGNISERNPLRGARGIVRRVSRLPNGFRRLGHYGLALFFVAIAAVLRWALPDVLGPTPFLAFYLAWVGAAAFGGLWPGLLAVGASWLCIDLFFDPANNLIRLGEPTTAGRLVILLAGGLAVSFVAEKMRRGRIRERRQSQELARAKQEWERTFDAVPDLIAIIDPQHRIMRVNRAMAERTGTSLEGCAGLTCYECVHNLGTPLALCPHDQSLADGREHSVEIYEKRLGGYFFVTCTPLRDQHGHMIGTVHVARDITQRKQAEQVLRDSEERFRAAYEQAAIGIEMLALDGRLLRGNGWLGRMLGYSEEELQQRTFAAITHPDDLHEELPLLNRLLAGEITNYSIEKRYIHKDGHPVWVRVTSSLARTSDPYRISIIEDITERKHAEQALQEAHERLQMQAEELQTSNEELAAQEEELRVANEELREQGQALRKSEAQLRTVVENLAEGLVVADLDGRLFHWNRAALEMHGFASLEECRRWLPELADTFELSTLDGEVLPVEQWPLARILRGENLRDWEVRVRRTGRDWERVFSYGGSLVRDEQGQQLLAVVTVNDITQRKQAEEAMREANERLHEQAEELQAQAEELQEQAAELTAANTALRQSQDALRRSHDELEERVRERTAELLSANEQLGLEITERKRAEEAIENERQRLYDVMEMLPAYVILLTPDHHVPFANRFFRERFGDSCGRRCFEYLFGRADPCENCETYKALEANSSHHWEWTGPDGRDYDIFDFPFTDVDGSPLIMEMGIDVTERKQAERAIRQANEALEHRARQLQELTLELSQAEDRERKRLAEILHDDLQQILAAAKFHLGLVKNRAKRDASLLTTVVQIDHMLKDAIDKSRSLSHELSPVVLHRGDFAEMFEWLASQIQAKHGLVVRVHAQGQISSESEALKTLLYKAAQELLFNVVKHARVNEAGIRIRRAGRCIYLSVSDRGRGFDPQQLKEAAGFGLLSIRERVELLGGRMRIKSVKDKGTRFLIMVPDGELTATAPSPRERPAPESQSQSEAARARDEGRESLASQAPSRALRVLLADDHEIVRQGLISLLDEEQMIEIVGEAANGREAVNLASELRPDVIIMDVSMPLIDGDEATRQIKRLLPGTRVVALSMFEDAETITRMRTAGAEAYILKTASAEDLLAAIRGKASDS